VQDVEVAISNTSTPKQRSPVGQESQITGTTDSGSEDDRPASPKRPATASSGRAAARRRAALIGQKDRDAGRKEAGKRKDRSNTEGVAQGEEAEPACKQPAKKKRKQHTPKKGEPVVVDSDSD
jgi:hypothetical protein